MKFTALALGLLPLAAAGSEGLLDRASGGLSPKVDLDSQARRAASAMLARGDAPLAARIPQAAATSTAAAAVSTSGLPSQADTNAACQTQLAKLNGTPSNPSGKSVCYNIAAINNQTGAFEAQVLVYSIGLPTGLWTSLLDKGESVTLAYPGGQVQADAQKLTLPPDTGIAPTLNASLLFTGQLNSSMLSQMGNLDAMRAALTPQISISAETSDGQFLNTTASNGEASFIDGFFSSPSFTESQAEAAAASGTPFVLPGTTFGIFPTGLIVTGVWTVLFVAAFAYGTFGRYQFRQSYRRRAGSAPAPRRAAGPPQGAPGAAAYDMKR